MSAVAPERLGPEPHRDLPEFDRLPQILRVAAKSFAQHGFTGVSMRDIGAGCGVRAPALYRYVGGKADLLFRIIADVSANLNTGAIERLKTTTDCRSRLSVLVDWHVENAIDDPDTILVQDREWAHLAPEAQKQVRALQRAYLELWVSTLTAVRPELDPPVARTIVQATIRLINSTPQNTHLDPDKLRQVLSRMALGALYS